MSRARTMWTVQTELMPPITRKDGSSYQRHKHTIRYGRRIIETTYGSPEIEGKRCQKIVEECNEHGVVPSTTICGADLGGGRGKALNRISPQV